MPRKEISTESNGNRDGSPAELAARAEIEKLVSRPLSNSDWVEERNRMIEFVRTLARWDAEQRNRKRHLRIA